MEFFIYKRAGEREDYEINNLYYPLKVGENDDVAICRAENKEDAIVKLSKYFTDCSKKRYFL